jgi:cobalt-zinc-cadmium efflux system outer membrane protein
MTRSFGHCAVLAAASVLTCAGCTSTPSDSGFSDVAKTVQDRTGADIRWNPDRPTDSRRLEEAVQSLLTAAPLSADTAVRVALLGNEGLAATYEELGIARAEVMQAGLPHNPTLTGELRLPKYEALPFRIDLEQSFIDLLLLPLRKRSAGAAFDAAKLRVTADVLSTAAGVTVAFYRTQGAAELANLRRTVLAAADASLEAARRLHEAGNINDLRFAQEQALMEQARLDLARAEAELLDAREELNALMGLYGEQTTAWDLSPRLPDLPPTEVDVHGLEALAIQQRADLAAASSAVAQAAANAGLARYGILGDLALGGHVEKDSDGDFTIGPSLTVPLPLFNQGQPAAAEAAARLRQAEHRYRALAIDVRADVRRRRNKLTAARARVEYLSRVVLPLRRQITRQTMLQFNGMFISVFELLQAKQAEIDAGREYVEALTNYWVARAELERAVGGKLPAPLPATQPATMPATSPATTSEHHHHGD